MKPRELSAIISSAVPRRQAGNPLEVVLTSGVQCGGRTLFATSGKDRDKVFRIEVPGVSESEARAIRMHELIHAAHPRQKRIPKGINDLARNAAMDVIVHTDWWPKGAGPGARADAIAMARTHLYGLREVSPKSANDWNTCVAVAVRSVAILKHFGRDCEIQSIDACLGVDCRREIVEAVGIRPRNKLILAIDKLMMREERESGGSNKGGDKGSGPKSMVVAELEKPIPCTATSPAMQPARSGALIRSGRLAAAVINKSAKGLFMRRRSSSPEGTWLFDASGSMRVSDSLLQWLCGAAPGALVAYYSDYGWDAPKLNRLGTLCVYARNGMRASRIQQRGGANEVDYFAVKWLLDQPGPRFLVSDLQFCGGPAFQATLGLGLVDEALRDGRLTVVPTVEDAAKMLGC